jgi:hypothetical protein
VRASSAGLALRQIAPAREIAHQRQQGVARAGRQFVGIGNVDRGAGQRQIAAPAGVAVQLFQRLVAQPALGGVVDALEGKVVDGCAISRR